MGPILVDTFTWSETVEDVIIHVQFQRKLLSNTDIFACNDYIKVSSSPYLFELFLLHDVDEQMSKCLIIDEKAIFELKKKELGLWFKITKDLDKKQKISRKKQIFECKQLKDKELRASKKEKLRELLNLAVHEQIELNSNNRKVVEDLKSNEKKKAMLELEEWKSRNCAGRVAASELAQSGIAMNSSLNEVQLSRCEIKIQTPDSFPSPLIRQFGNIQVKFSAREFPTPARESLLHEEAEFLKKQLDARKATGFVSEDLRPEECNPMWLKNKGDSFYNSKNYLGAVSAYSHAIKIAPKMASLYSNRAAAHMELGNLHKALEDCSTALDLLTPPVAVNADARARAHARRAVILCRLNLPDKSIPEFQEALKLRPDDSQLHLDLKKALHLAEEDDESDV